MTLYLVRHAHAGDRSAFEADDRLRPLSPKGRAQAQGLLDRYGDRPITRVLSSPSLRCQQTVAPIARHRGLDVQICDPLDERSPADEGIALLRSLAGEEVILCSHGDVIPDIMRTLIDQGFEVDGGAAASKAGVFEFETDGTNLVSAQYVGPPVLARD